MLSLFVVACWFLACGHGLVAAGFAAAWPPFFVAAAWLVLALARCVAVFCLPLLGLPLLWLSGVWLSVVWLPLAWLAVPWRIA